MGISGFHKYCKFEIANSFKHVDILAALAELKTTSDGSKPVVIICIRSMQTYFQSSIEDMLLGSRYNMTCRKFEDFLSKFSDVQLVFPISFTEVNEERLHQKNKLDNYEVGLEIINKIQSCNNFEELSAHYRNLKLDEFVHNFPVDYNMFYPLLEVAGRFGQILPFSNSVHHEIMMFSRIALDLNAFAVIGFNSNFIVSEGPWKYWSSNDLDITNMTIVEYDKNAILNHLGLNYQQMPLFVSLAGSKLKWEDKELIRRSFGPKQYLYLNMASFVKKKEFPLKFTAVQEISRYLSRGNHRITKHFIGDLQKSLRIFSLPKTLDNKCEAIENYKIHAQNYVLNILLETPIYIQFFFADLRKTDLMPMNDLTLTILRKTAGILLKNCDVKTPIDSVLVCTKYDHAGDFVVEKHRVIDPEIEVPDFQDLVNGNMSYVEKLRILLYLTNLDLSEDQFDSVPTDDLLPVITLIYLMVNRSLKMNEAIAILKVLREDKQNNIPESIEYPEIVDLRIFRVSNLLSAFYYFFKNCLNSIGFEKQKFDMHLDGVYFQKIMLNNPGAEIEVESAGNMLKCILKHV